MEDELKVENEARESASVSLLGLSTMVRGVWVEDGASCHAYSMTLGRRAPLLSLLAR